MDLREAEDIKKRWQEYTELYKRDIHDPGNHNGVITYLEPDILECEVKWTLGSITTNKASGGDGIPVELFQILKDDALQVLHSLGSARSKCGELKWVQLKWKIVGGREAWCAVVPGVTKSWKWLSYYWTITTKWVYTQKRSPLHQILERAKSLQLSLRKRMKRSFF